MCNTNVQGNNHKVAGTQELKTFEFTVKALAVTKVKARSEKEAWAKFKKQGPGKTLNEAYLTAIGTSEEDVLLVKETD